MWLPLLAATRCAHQLLHPLPLPTLPTCYCLNSAQRSRLSRCCRVAWPTDPGWPSLARLAADARMRCRLPGPSRQLRQADCLKPAQGIGDVFAQAIKTSVSKSVSNDRNECSSSENEPQARSCVTIIESSTTGSECRISLRHPLFGMPVHGPAGWSGQVTRLLRWVLVRPASTRS